MFGFVPLIDSNLLYKREHIILALESQGYLFNRSEIKRYQKEHGLPVTGVIDLLTLNSLNRIHHSNLNTNHHKKIKEENFQKQNSFNFKYKHYESLNDMSKDGTLINGDIGEVNGNCYIKNNGSIEPIYFYQNNEIYKKDEQ